MNNLPEELDSAIMDTALAPWPQARFLMLVGLMACLPRTEDDVGVEVMSSPGLAAADMTDQLISAVSINTADGPVVIDPDEQLPFLDLLTLIDSLSRHEDADDRILGVKALIQCALATPDWTSFG